MGRAAVHEVSARLGMDPREVASRLVALSATGLPLLVGVECDPNGLRAALSRMTGPVVGYGVHGTPSGAYPPPQQGYPQQQQYPPPHHGYPQTGPQQMQAQSGPYPVRTGPPSQPFPVHAGPPVQAGEVLSTWGPPQSSSWARGDQPPSSAAISATDRTQPTTRPPSREGVVGVLLEAEGLEGERLAIKLIEFVDPADYLFTAAGYRLQPGERSIVVHTELTNRGSGTFGTLPDLYLVLVTKDGESISKAPVSLSSRPPHRIGVAPGETAGGHTVYVVPEEIEVVSVQWSPRPDEESRTLTWAVES